MGQKTRVIEIKNSNSAKNPIRRPVPAPKQWQIIDLVRSGCVIAVMGVHFYSNVPFDSPWKARLWGRFCVNGFYGVFLFFMVSGFLITHVIARQPPGLLKPNLLIFYVRRIGRIWPLFFLCLLFGTAIFLFAPTHSALYRNYFTPSGNHDFWFWLSLPTFLFNWLLVFRPDWNYSVHWMILWSLSIEEQFYLLYPWFLRKMGNLKVFLLCLGLILLTAVAWRTFFYFYAGHNDFIQSYASLSKFDLIACGILLYLAVQTYGPRLSRRRGICVLLCATGLAVLLAAYFGTQENDPLAEIFVPEALAVGLFGFLLGGLHLSFFESSYLKILSLPGKYCYGCYLLHPIVLFFTRFLLDKMSVFYGFAFFILVTTLVATVSYRFFELPANRFIRRAWG